MLEEAGRVEARREGTRHLYAVRPEGFTRRGLRGRFLGLEAPERGRGEQEEEDLMATFRTTIDLEAPPDVVFDHFVRPELLVGLDASRDTRCGAGKTERTLLSVQPQEVRVAALRQPVRNLSVRVTQTGI